MHAKVVPPAYEQNSRGATMTFQGTISLIVSFLSLLTAVAAIYIARLTFRQQQGTQSWITNHSLLLKSYDMIIENPKLLSLFGINVENCKKDGLTAEELIFINISMDASSVFHKIADGERVELTPYRKQFLQNKKVRIAWKNVSPRNASTPQHGALQLILT